MPRSTPVRRIMTTDVVSFGPDETVTDAMSELVANNVDGAPVVDDDGRVVGLLSTGDLIVSESRLHVPTVISLLGAQLELPSSAKRFDEDVRRALGGTVGEVMTPDPVIIEPDETLEVAATRMHDQEVSRLPVVDDDGVLVGLVSRGDVVKAMIAEYSDDGPTDPTEPADPVTGTEPGDAAGSAGAADPSGSNG